MSWLTCFLKVWTISSNNKVKHATIDNLLSLRRNLIVIKVVVTLLEITKRLKQMCKKKNKHNTCTSINVLILSFETRLNTHLKFAFCFLKHWGASSVVRWLSHRFSPLHHSYSIAPKLRKLDFSLSSAFCANHGFRGKSRNQGVG